MTSAKERPNDLPTLEAERDKAAAKAAAKGDKLADARAEAKGKTDPATESAVAAAEVARQAQGDVDRTEQSIRSGGFTTADLASTSGPHGVVGDATGGPLSERKAAEENARRSR